eukprot:298944_1
MSFDIWEATKADVKRQVTMIRRKHRSEYVYLLNELTSLDEYTIGYMTDRFERWIFKLDDDIRDDDANNKENDPFNQPQVVSAMSRPKKTESEREAVNTLSETTNNKQVHVHTIANDTIPRFPIPLPNFIM